MATDQTRRTLQDRRDPRGAQTTIDGRVPDADPLRRGFRGSAQRAAVYAGQRPLPPPARLVPRG